MGNCGNGSTSLRGRPPGRYSWHGCNKRDAEQRQQLEQALASRTVIDQALGILMGQQRSTAEEAFTLLRMRSQSSQQKLRDVATALVTRVTGQPASEGKMFDAARTGEQSSSLQAPADPPAPV
jgi:hypothetical protein